MQAIVIGGGIGGLLAARVLCDHFESVHLLEKDEGSGSPRPGVAQGAHLHVLLQGGQARLVRLLPELAESLTKCPEIDWAEDTHWDLQGRTFPRYRSGITTRSLSRPFLEQEILRALSKWTNLHIHRNSPVIRIDSSQVECAGGQRFNGELVVIAGGQNFPVERALNLPSLRAQTREHPLGITYRSVRFRLADLRLPGCRQYYAQVLPHERAPGSVIYPIEDGEAITTLIQYGPAPARGDFAEFSELARQVRGRELAEILAHASPLGPVSTFHKSRMTERRPDRVALFPERVILLGDALGSLNPAFGQGMTLAIEQAEILDRLLRAGNFSARTFHRAARRKLRTSLALCRLGSSPLLAFALRAIQCSRRLHRVFLHLLHRSVQHA